MKSKGRPKEFWRSTSLAIDCPYHLGRYDDTKMYFSALRVITSWDGALRDGRNFRITGRVDDVVIVSGHNLGTAPIENAINEHPKWSIAVVGSHMISKEIPFVPM